MNEKFKITFFEWFFERSEAPRSQIVGHLSLEPERTADAS